MTAREAPEHPSGHDTTPPLRRPGYAAGLFLGQVNTDLLALPEGDPRRLDPAEERFLSRLREFCEKEVDSAGIERADRIPDHVIEGLKDIGAMSIKVPRQYGGLGLSSRCYHRALMLTSTTHPALSELLAGHQAIGLAQPIALFGTEEQKRQFLPRCVREISAFALTEADIGNDPFRMHTKAVHDPASDSYVLDGVKTWTTNAVVADLLVVMALVPASENGAGGMTAFVVEADTPGVTVEHRSAFLGLRGLENGSVRLHQVVVPARNRIGAEGEGLTIALAAQDTGRLSLPAVCAAAAKWSLSTARQWSAARVQWGRPIGQHDAVAGKLSFIAATAFALEAMVEVIGRQAEQGDTDARLDAELAKLFATEQAWVVADELVQIRGGRGYETAESAAGRGERGIPVEQLLRDVRIGRIFDGSSEALRGFLAHDLIAAHRSSAGQREAVPTGRRARGDGSVLDTHLAFVEQTSRRLARELAAIAEGPTTEIDERQRFLGRIVDIGAELYAMSASCVYAEALDAVGASAARLADAFCRQARLRIVHLFDRLADNTDEQDRGLAHSVLGGDHTWLEDGVVDPSTDGPWIAEPEPGPAKVPSLRRVLRAADSLTATPSMSDGPTRRAQ
ncbi:acyl-CoA dehydrogenase family protein [Streptomyces capitiformicae]|uniref:Acyl-CoA dehydrogenase FadE10 n=1 Tax=Streptomyces capitiformicae TaxID=2014920 RepID=A0A919DLP7_9ACTN|nr:acyl-CoA dehydrogenase family protein [Streptomyces capitiformicae]GHE57256.1 putative acyl-CoA dehydrogenase FadE10 [Streptomyces capitiformicae]